jgi:tetratricopeptide (TPR) repeat protein
MSEDREESVEVRRGTHADAVALAIASGANDDELKAEARTYLRNQNKLSLLQIDDLKREDRVRHWSLRVRHVSDVLKLSFELSFAFIVLIVAIWLGASVWSAAHDNDLVIESFSVPPDFASRGLTGEVIASDILDRVSTLATTGSLMTGFLPGVYRPDTANEIRVQIPETGVSVGQLYSYLVHWLGHERHITGSVYRSGGGLVLTIRIEGSVTRSFRGSETDFDHLEQQAVEELMAQTQPGPYAAVLVQRNRVSDALAFIPQFTTKGSATDRARAYVSWAVLLQFTDDLRAVVEKCRLAIRTDPIHVLGLGLIYGPEAVLGEDEASLADAIASARASKESKIPNGTQLGLLQGLLQSDEWINEERGDFQAATESANELSRFPFYLGTSWVPSLIAQDLASQHDVAHSRRILLAAHISEDASIAASTAGVFATIPPMPRYYEDMELGDWNGGLAQIETTYREALRKGSPVVGYVPTFFLPWFAYAQLKVGHISEAQTLINRSPVDCYLCLRVRAQIDIAKKNWGGAVYWFDRAVQAAPSIPIAYADWGEMLLRHGDYDGAIAKFEEAHEKGPHFADPLEMWGEALMLKNRSDLALAKFEEATSTHPIGDDCT